MELGDQKSWERAREVAEQLGIIPSFFNATVRYLRTDQYNNVVNGRPFMRPLTKYLACKSFRGQKLLSMFYASAEQLMPEKIEEATSVTLGKLLNYYEPIDVAALFGNYYLYRRAISILEDTDSALVNNMQIIKRESQIGAYVGVAIPTIGIAPGLLVGTLRRFPRLCFIKADPDRYEKYIAALKESEVDEAPEIDFDYFGCTTLQVASVLLSLLGFGVTVCEQYVGGLSPNIRIHQLADDDGSQARSFYAIKFAKMWIDCLQSGDDQPVTQMPGEFYPLADARELLESRVETVLNSASNKHWIDNSPEDITEEKAPKLYATDEKDKEVPEQLRDVFSFDEICEMEELEFDDLIDQLDRDKAIGDIPDDPDEQVP